MRLEVVFASQALQYPNKTAVIDNATQLSYRDLADSVLRCAHGLQRLGLNSGDRLVLYASGSIAFVQLFYAALSIGAIVVPVSERMSLRELEYFCDDSGATILAVHPDRELSAANIVSRMPVLTLLTMGEAAQHGVALGDLLQSPPEPLPELTTAQDDAIILYTSGTTGQPKGVVLTHANLFLQHGCLNCIEWGISAQDCQLVATPLAHRTGLGRLISALSVGGTIVILPSFDAELVMQILQDQHVTVFGMVPTMCRMLLPYVEAEPEKCASLKLCVVTGEAFPVDLKKRLLNLLPHLKLVSYYASTEAGVVTKLLHDAQLTHPASVGLPATGVEVKIVEDNGDPVKCGDVGEIWVRSGTPGAYKIMKGYFNRPEADASVFTGDWFHTGDLARQDKDGFYYIVDRKKDMIVSGGYNIYSKEVELTLRECPGVGDVAVVGIPDPDFGEAVIAFIEPSNRARPPSELDVITYCREQIASYKKPKKIVFVQALPRNTLGKIMKRDLPKIALNEPK